MTPGTPEFRARIIELLQELRTPEHNVYLVVVNGEPWDVYQIEASDGAWTIGLNPNRSDLGASCFAAQGRFDKLEFVKALTKRPRVATGCHGC